jgi:DNA-binding transcriptional MocR family regulator
MHFVSAATIWLKEYGMDVHEDGVIISAGAQHGLNCTLAGLFAGGDRVTVEHLTYPGFKTLAAMLGITLVSIEMDDQGMMPEALDTACRREKIRGVFV